MWCILMYRHIKRDLILKTLLVYLTLNLSKEEIMAVIFINVCFF